MNWQTIRQRRNTISVSIRTRLPLRKLKTNRPLTDTDVKTLQEILWGELGTKEDYEREYGEKPLGEFVREIVGLDMNAAKEAFSAYLNEANLDSRQIYILSIRLWNTLFITVC